MIIPPDIIKGGLEIVGGVLDWSEKHRDRKTKKERDDLAKALRAIYFTPNGTISLIEQILEGKKPTAKERQRILTNFNDVEWKVRGALELLKFDDRFRSLSVSLSTARQLDEIRYGKINVRMAIQDSLNSYGQPGKKVDLTKLQNLLAGIKKLNSMIEAIEETINVRAK